jgi:N-acetylneuraminic acid mutarotase
MVKKFVFFCLLLLVVCSSCETVSEGSPMQWSRMSDFPGAARASASGFVLGSKAYICCGRTAFNSNFINEVWEYDAPTDTWTRKSDFPGTPRAKVIACTIGDKAYVGLGGNIAYYTDNRCADFYEYDPLTDTWTRKSDFPGAGRNDLTYAVVDGCLYTTLGFSSAQRCHETYRYDPKTDTWTELERVPVTYSAAAGFGLDQSFYAGTGYNGFNQKVFFRYDTETAKWSEVASLPEGRVLSEGLSIGDKGYIMLGRYWAGSQNGGKLLSDILEYNPDNDTWTRRGHFPGGGRQNAVVLHIEGTGYVFMGEDDSAVKSDVWTFKP